MSEASDALLAWYDAARRDLPWRRAAGPWPVLLSELMLQQTRVETVVPYFERFLARWPTVASFASASEEEVLAAWSGLGYYRRARNLLAAARAATSQGGFPPSVEGLRSLPGVGDYTARAIAAIAFGVPVIPIDGNVERVASRWFGVAEDPARPAVRRRLQAQLDGHANPDRSGDLAQAFIELGATVCTPRSPRCEVCPLRPSCVAAAEGRQAELPAKAPKKAPTPVEATAVVLGRRGLVLMGRRREGLLGGLWEPLMASGRWEPAIVAERSAGVSGSAWRRVASVTHVFTHRRLTADVWVGEGGEEPLAGDGHYDAVAWIDPARTDVGISTMAAKILAAAGCGRR
jgi:A/G-specific adenine glycosylase